ncbi:manganese efflux pump MntP family protein [Brevundimonas sp. NPDC092305]|uniref:manganese efflux pump MntP n=1 Tax=Brevundimonas sp. NPDC092305 TaxID=3363957 RepID=UPI0038148F35
MTPLSIAVLSLSMSTDAFAAAVGRGAAHRPGFATAVRNGLVFGIIEGITPLIGWAMGLIAAGFVEQVDHWIAFGLLGAVGAKMLWESFQPVDEEARPARAGRNAILALIATAVGTSIDAAAVGVGMAFIGANIWLIAACIGFTTFVLTTIGMLIGRAVGVRFGKVAEFLGGVALILIGLSILAEHMGWLGA